MESIIEKFIYYDNVMNILIINIVKDNINGIPLGIGYITTSLKQAGISFDFWDPVGNVELIEGRDVNFKVGEALTYILNNKRYDIVCMGGNPSHYNNIKYAITKIKSVLPESKIVIGGTLATFSYGIVLQKADADIAVIGEGDVTIVDLIRTIIRKEDLSNVEGIVFKKGDQLIKTGIRSCISDLDTLPFVDMSFFKIDKTNPPPLSISTARGCVGKCSFCVNGFKGYKYRCRSIKSIITEMEQLISSYPHPFFLFSDELSFSNKKRIKHLCESIIRKKITATWDCTCRGNVFNQDKDLYLLEMMKEAGCKTIYSSLESASLPILKEMNKGITTEEYAKQLYLIRRAGLDLSCSVIFGYFSETEETIRETINWLIEHRLMPGAGFLVPFPGSEVYEQAVKMGRIRDEEKLLQVLGSINRDRITVNLTNMSDLELFSYVREGLIKVAKEVDTSIKFGENSLLWGFYSGRERDL